MKITKCLGKKERIENRTGESFQVVTETLNQDITDEINQSIKFYLYSPYSQPTVRLIGL